MEDSMTTEACAKRLAELLRPYTEEQAEYENLYADLIDLVDLSQWYLNSIDAFEAAQIKKDDLETFLIDLDVRLSHFADHIASLRNGISPLLTAISDADHN